MDYRQEMKELREKLNEHGYRLLVALDDSRTLRAEGTREERVVSETGREE